MESNTIAIFSNLCPNCGNEITDVRLKDKIACEKCCEYVDSSILCKALKSRLKFKKICEVKEKLKAFSEYFREKTGFHPWSLQLMWARRTFMGRSFAIQAPTGVGKTTFGIIMAAFVSGKSYIVFPTRLLVSETLKKLSEVSDKKIVAYTGKKKEKKSIEEGDFDILITTYLFMYKNIDLLTKFNFNFIFIDDVDSILKRPKNIDAIFRLLGLNQNQINLALKISKKKERDEKDENILNGIKKSLKGTLVVSSATLKPKSARVNLFRTILGFDIQQSISTIRNINDFYIKCSSWNEIEAKALEIVNVLGPGCFMFVPVDKGKNYVEKLVEFLNKNEIHAISYEKFPEYIEEFKNGKVKVVVGISIPTNPLVRGVDLPLAVRYVVFCDVPKHMFPIKLKSSPLSLFYILKILSPLFDENEEKTVAEYLTYLKRYLSLKEDDVKRYPSIEKKLNSIKSFVEAKLNDKSFIDSIEKSEDITIETIEDEQFIIVADVTSYIQASGRTSRLVAGQLTKGVSIVLASDIKALNNLIKRVRYYLPSETKIEELSDIETLSRLKSEIDKSRDIEKLLKKAKPEDLIKTALVIVESPYKARTISSFFGKPQRRWLDKLISYEVGMEKLHLIIAASVGHVLDLEKEHGFFGVIRLNNKFIPIYEIIKEPLDKSATIEAIRQLAFEADTTIIATDPDAEGEKIAWDIFLAISPFAHEIVRAEFHEVTPHAFRKAIEEARNIDINRVKAQIVRRVADRWVGFTFSQIIQEKFKNKHLSAGRVQTPVLGWVIDRNKESKKKKAIITFKYMNLPFKIEFEDVAEAKRIFEKLKRNKFTINASIKDYYETEIKPKPPFITSELLTAASEELGFSAEYTMDLAQHLFETGFITYHRTDSHRVSSAGVNIAREFIEKTFGKDMFVPRSWQEEGAHECIRPTKVITPSQFNIMVSSGEVEIDGKAVDIYKIIFERFIASQMKAARVRKAKVSISIDGYNHEQDFIVDIIDRGFTILSGIEMYRIIKDKGIEDVNINIVPKVYPFTEGSLINEMKKRGLGRPSTYAKIVQTLLDRKYVVKRGKYLYPTSLGISVYNYLTYFAPYTTEEFTRILEDKMDMVEKAEEDYQKILTEIYDVRKYLDKD